MLIPEINFSALLHAGKLEHAGTRRKETLLFFYMYLYIAEKYEIRSSFYLFIYFFELLDFIR